MRTYVVCTFIVFALHRVLTAGVGDGRGSANQLVQLLHQYQAAMAESYCRLILGIDMEEHHHMKAGK